MTKPIVAAVDLSAVTSTVVEEGAALSKAFGVPLYVVHVEPPEPDFVGYDPGPKYVRDSAARDAMAHHETVKRLREQAAEQDVEAHGVVIQGPAAEKILGEAERLDARFIVLGSHGHGALYRLLLGSVSQAVLNRATVPVMIVPARETGESAAT